MKTDENSMSTTSRNLFTPYHALQQYVQQKIKYQTTSHSTHERAFFLAHLELLLF